MMLYERVSDIFCMCTVSAVFAFALSPMKV